MEYLLERKKKRAKITELEKEAIEKYLVKKVCDCFVVCSSCSMIEVFSY